MCTPFLPPYAHLTCNCLIAMLGPVNVVIVVPTRRK